MNSSPETSLFKQDNFQVQLISSSNELTIQAENVITLKRFQATITPGNVRELTSSIFPDLEVLHAGLLDAFERKDPAVTVSLTDDGKLTYSWDRMLRDKKRLDTFTLELTEEKIDDLTRLSRQVEKLLKKVEQQEDRIDMLEKENRQLKSDAEKALLQKLETIEQKAIPQVKKEFEKEIRETEKKLKEFMGKALSDFERIMNIKVGDDKPLQSKEDESSFEFDPTEDATSVYNFLNGNKALETKISTNGVAVFTKTPLSKSKMNKFSVRADLTDKGSVSIGVCPSEFKDNMNIENQKGSYYYYGYGDGSIYIDGNAIDLSLSGLKSGSVITVTVDPLKSIITFDIDGIQIHTGIIPTSYEYYPFIQAYHQYDKFTCL